MLADVVEELLGDDISDTLRRATPAGILLVFRQIVTVVEGDLLPRVDLAGGHNMYVSINQFCFAVRMAAMIDEPGGVPGNIAIQILSIRQGKDILVVTLAPLQGLRLGNALANVFNDPCARRNEAACESPRSVNARWSNCEPLRFSDIPCQRRLVFCHNPDFGSLGDLSK